MNREQFCRLVEEALEGLPAKFRERVKNVAIVVEDRPRGEASRPRGDEEDDSLMGVFEGVPATSKSVWDITLPSRIVLYQKNIEAVCDSDEEIRKEVRLTVLHELGHYFGMSEEQLEDV